jgi:hypothetical protein
LVLSKEKPIPYQPPLPPNKAPSGVDAAAGATPVGLRPPFVTPAAAHSHPDCRGILILIVAPQLALWEASARLGWVDSRSWPPVTAVVIAIVNGFASGELAMLLLSSLRLMSIGYVLGGGICVVLGGCWGATAICDTPSSR